MIKSLGQIDYEGYCASTGGKSAISGAKLPAWADQAPVIIKAWEDAAEAVKRAIESGVREVVEEVATDDYFVLATIIKNKNSGDRDRSNVRIGTFIDAVHAIDRPENRQYDTIDYWNGKAWQCSVLSDPRHGRGSATRTL